MIGSVPTNQSWEEKYGWSLHSATSSRPVAARASRTAVLVASEAFLQNLTMSAPGTIDRKSSAAASSISVGRVNERPSVRTSRTASSTGS